MGSRKERDLSLPFVRSMDAMLYCLIVWLAQSPCCNRETHCTDFFRFYNKPYQLLDSVESIEIIDWFVLFILKQWNINNRGILGLQKFSVQKGRKWSINQSTAVTLLDSCSGTLWPINQSIEHCYAEWCIRKTFVKRVFLPKKSHCDDLKSDHGRFFFHAEYTIRKLFKTHIANVIFKDVH